MDGVAVADLRAGGCRVGGGGLRPDLPRLSFRMGSCLRPPDVVPEGWPVCSSAGHYEAGLTSSDQSPE